LGVDYSHVAAGAAQRRADELGLACRYVVGMVPAVPLADRTADLVYTGKGALMWMPDLAEWARVAARLIRPGGHLFIYERHPATVLWTWDSDRARIRQDRSYFDRSHVNDTFPARGAQEWQWNLGQVVTAIAAAGMEILSLGEYPEPFYRWGGVEAAAWDGRLPNSFTLLARRKRLRVSRAPQPAGGVQARHSVSRARIAARLAESAQSLIVRGHDHV
jgi:SAM-dependent methyltransferase